ncbi:CRISPR-associated endonuclease Cas2 [Holzapfeliella sp. JNUCC 80]
MRLVVMFDLPVSNSEDRRNASKFRNYLLKDGYVMLQYSIYYRIVTGIDMAEKYEKRIKQVVPSRGSIRLLKVTEKQFKEMDVLVGYRSPTEEKITDNSFNEF